MIIVYPDGNKDSAGKYIRPTPLISISQNPLRNKMGKIGSSYDITLNGAIITGRRSPIVDDLDVEETIPDNGPFSLPEKLPEILYRQNQLREYFAKDGVYVEVMDINGDEKRLAFYAKVNSVSFDEGIYVDICRYTINLTADYLIDSNSDLLGESVPQSGIIDQHPSGYRDSIDNIINSVGGMVEDFNDTWSIETDEANGNFINGKFVPRSYRITRNMTATGKTIFGLSEEKDPWEHARDFIKKNVESGYFYSSFSDILTSGFLGIPSGYRGYNHIRSESIDKGAGSYSVSDSFILSSGDTALENYNLSVSSSTDNPFVKVSIDGNIKGLSPLEASGYLATDQIQTPYDYAYSKYLEISNSGQFGIGCDMYKRANNSTAQQLNSQPNSISLGVNQVNGEITYNLEFDNRPTNYFYNVLSESISVNDTYPGDVFAVIPVIGRATGPILQYIGGRTEYKRDVNIEIRLDSTDIGYNNNRNSLMLTKPSVNEPIRTQLNDLILALSPASEPGIRKYFLNPPAENWSPKDGIYSIALSWVYELNR
jgi:hypothetical protein